MENNEKKRAEDILEILHNLKKEDMYYVSSLDLSRVREVEDTIVNVPLDKYEELLKKATTFDILTSALRRMGEVSPDIIWAMTGADPDVPIKKLREESKKYWGWYSDENEKVKKLQEKVERLQKIINEMSAEKAPEEGGNG